MEKENYIVRVAEKNETASVISFLELHHMNKDPITHGFITKYKNQMTTEDKIEMEKSIVNFVENNPCLVAIHKKNQEIVGTLILVPTGDPNILSPELQEDTNIKKRKNPWIALGENCMNIYKEINFYQKFPNVKQGINLRRLAVHEKHRGKGLATCLLREAVEWAKKNKFDIVYSFFTMPAAKKAATKAAFKTIMEYDLNTVKDANGEFTFGNLKPNNVTSIMAIVIKS